MLKLNYITLFEEIKSYGLISHEWCYLLYMYMFCEYSISWNAGVMSFFKKVLLYC